MMIAGDLFDTLNRKRNLIHLNVSSQWNDFLLNQNLAIDVSKKDTICLGPYKTQLTQQTMMDHDESSLLSS